MGGFKKWVPGFKKNRWGCHTLKRHALMAMGARARWLPPFFYQANILKYIGAIAASLYALSGNRKEATTLHICVLVLIALKWLSAIHWYFRGA